MLKAYAVALVLSSSTPVGTDTQETARPLDKQQEQGTTELYLPKPWDIPGKPNTPKN